MIGLLFWMPSAFGQELEKLQTNYQQLKTRHEAAGAKSLATAREQLDASMKKLEQYARSRGDLDLLLATKKAFDADNPQPPPKDWPPLTDLLTRWERTQTSHDREKRKRLGSLVKKYEAALIKLQKKL
ncbi:MAG: hypothetical protein AAF492_26945, partial [Verrucomicrobiota bacterium]